MSNKPMNPRLKRGLQIAVPAFAVGVGTTLWLQQEATSPPAPTVQERLVYDMDQAAYSGTHGTAWHAGSLVMQPLIGNKRPFQASPAAEHQLLVQTFGTLYAAAGYTDQVDTLVPIRLQADAACVTALANTATRRVILAVPKGAVESNVETYYSDALTTESATEATADLNNAATLCQTADEHALEAGATLLVPTGLNSG